MAKYRPMLADSHIANICATHCNDATGITDMYGVSQARQALQACACTGLCLLKQ